ncbi:MAG: YraN family protein [Christensenellaceae bacterium]
MFNSPKDFYKKLFGKRGERLAVSYLKKQGYRIIETNYVTHYGEADIIAVYDDILCFIEVKSRTSDKFGKPCEAVDGRKQAKYRQIAEYYIYANRVTDTNVRFDVVEVYADDEINHIKDAFQ